MLSDGQKSNLVLAKELWPQEDWADKENKEHLLDKIVRVRKKLMDKWLIQKYNTYGKETNVADVRSELLALLQENKQLPKEQRKTHAAIAELLGLDKDQVDNFSRSLKKTPPPSQQLKAG